MGIIRKWLRKWLERYEPEIPKVYMSTWLDGEGLWVWGDEGWEEVSAESSGSSNMLSR